jgi:hypothetical protein
MKTESKVSIKAVELSSKLIQPMQIQPSTSNQTSRKRSYNTEPLEQRQDKRMKVVVNAAISKELCQKAVNARVSLPLQNPDWKSVVDMFNYGAQVLLSALERAISQVKCLQYFLISLIWLNRLRERNSTENGQESEAENNELR